MKMTMSALNMLRRFLIVFFTTLLSGCVVGPDYRTPILDTPATWKNQLPAGTKNEVREAVQLSQWWNTLNDPLLTRLAEEAVANNLDLKQAQARLRESRARRGVAAADRYPTVKGGLTKSVNRSSGKTGTGDSRTSDNYSAQLDVGLDMDLFGGNRRALESATATLEASEENVRDVQVSLLAEVVLTYIDIRSFQTQIINTRNTIVSLQESSQITHWRSQAGLVSQLDEEQARMNLEQTRAQLPTLLNKLEQASNNLALLLGRSTLSMDELLAPAPIPFARAEIAIGVPAETLRQRPDIRRAERQLAAATAQVGKAEAARYPNFSLSGTIGMQSESLGNLLNPGAFMYSLANNAVQTIFDGGRLKQQVEIQNALQEQALITYKSTVRSALRDVENALSAYAGEQNRRRFLTTAVDAARNAVVLSIRQYSAGLVDYSTVLDSQRSLLSNQDQLIQSEAAVTSDLVRLYKTLGGGWTPVKAESSTTGITSLGEKG
jgi:NodT family efflux transporter outer membrane factor (OMF) lipoprotein